MNNDIDNKEWVNDYPALKAVAKSNAFTVPDGYFNASAEQILSSVKILELAPDNQASFGVPNNYFEDMQSNILSRVAIEEAFGNKEAFLIPENYFEDMQAQINTRIAIEEAAKEPFTVPDNYFNQLNAQILNRTIVADTVQRKGIIRKLVSTAAFKYASAACFAIVVGAVILLSQQNSPRAVHDKTYLHQALSQIPNSDIKGYLEMRVDANDTNTKMDDNNRSDLNSVSTDDMKDYLSNN